MSRSRHIGLIVQLENNIKKRLLPHPTRYFEQDIYESSKLTLNNTQMSENQTNMDASQ